MFSHPTSSTSTTPKGDFFQKYVGRMEIPEIFQKYAVNSAAQLRQKLEIKYPYLKEICDRQPTTPLMPGQGKMETLITKANIAHEILMFMTHITKEYDRVKNAIALVAYGVTEFANVMRLEIGSIAPYMFIRFPHWLFEASDLFEAARQCTTSQIEAMRKMINKKLLAFMPAYAATKLARMCLAQNREETDFITEMKIVYHLPAVGYNGDIAIPFLRLVCVDVDIVKKINFLLTSHFEGELGNILKEMTVFPINGKPLQALEYRYQNLVDESGERIYHPIQVTDYKSVMKIGDDGKRVKVQEPCEPPFDESIYLGYEICLVAYPHDLWREDPRKVQTNDPVHDRLYRMATYINAHVREYAKSRLDDYAHRKKMSVADLMYPYSDLDNFDYIRNIRVVEFEDEHWIELVYMKHSIRHIWKDFFAIFFSKEFVTAWFRPLVTINDDKLNTKWESFDADGEICMQLLCDHNMRASQWWKINTLECSEVKYSPPYYNVDVNVECTFKAVAVLEESHPVAKTFPDDVAFLFDGEMIKKMINNAVVTPGFVNAKAGDAIGQLGVQIIRTKNMQNRLSLNEAERRKMFYAMLLTALPLKNETIIRDNADQPKVVLTPMKFFESVRDDDENHGNKYSVRVLDFVRDSNRRSGFDQIEEHAMINAFFEIFLYVNPSYAVAFNGNRFDWPYLLDRAWMLTYDKEECERKEFDWDIGKYMVITRDFNKGRGIFHEVARKVTSEQVKRASARTATDKVHIPGVANFDLYNYIKQYAKYKAKSSYSLDATSARVLGEKKIEIDYNMIPIMFQNTKGRLSIAKYCNRDVELMARLMMALGALEFGFFLGQLTSVPIQQLLDRGTQHLVNGLWYCQLCVKDVSMLYSGKPEIKEAFLVRWQAHKERYFPDQQENPRFLLPNANFEIRKVEGPRSKKEGQKGGGADVIEPPSSENEMVYTLDFEGLYPSIMRTFGICPTTLLSYENREEVMAVLKTMMQTFNMTKDETYLKRKESWFCTGDSPTPHPSLKDAVAFLKSPQCNYPASMRKKLLADVEKLDAVEDQQLVEKWSKIALRKRDELTVDDFTKDEKSDKGLENAYLDFIEPISRVVGTTKVQYKDKEMPAFLGKGIREGVFPFIERMLAARRGEVKAQKSAYEDEIDRLLREGESESSEHIKSLKIKFKECDIIQNAIKVLMNSIYGYYKSRLNLGFTLQETICVYGQQLLQDTKNFMETIGSKCLGHDSNDIVVIGDTDSGFAKKTDMKNQLERREFFRKIYTQYNKFPVERCRIEPLMLITLKHNEILKNMVASGKILDKNRSKALVYMQWHFIVEEVCNFNEWNLGFLPFNPLRLPEGHQFTEKEKEVMLDLKAWFDEVMRDMGVNLEDPLQSEWKGIERAPNPPVLQYGNAKQLETIKITPLNVQMFFRWCTMNLMFKSCRKIERIINEVFKRKYKGVVRQQLEKIYERIVLYVKKKYAGCMWMPGAAAPYISATGISSVRGDCTPFKSNICKKTLELILEFDDIEGAKREGYRLIKDLSEGKVAICDLIQSKNIKKDLTEYGKKQKKYLRRKKPNGENEIVKIMVTRNMPVHIVAAINRHLRYNEPLPEIDDRYFFLVLAGVGSNVGERAVPPSVVIRSGGLVQYDRQYYIADCVRQITNLLLPVFDTRPFKVKMEQAEMFRRIKDKKVRSKLITKFIESQRNVVRKHMMNYAMFGTKMIDRNYIIEQNKTLLKNQGGDVRLLFQNYQTPTCSSSVVDDEPEEDELEEVEEEEDEESTVPFDMQVVDEMFNTAVFEDEEEEKLKEKSATEMIEWLDVNASKMTLKLPEEEITEEPDPKLLLLLEDDEEQPKKKAPQKKYCQKCKLTIAARSKKCPKCKMVVLTSEGQTFVHTFFERMNIKCILCDRMGSREICATCSESKDVRERLTALKLHINQKQVSYDCRVCADCFKVDAPEMPEKKGKKRNAAGDEEEEYRIGDLEDIVRNFHETNEIIKTCNKFSCAHLSVRLQNDRRLEIIKMLEYKFFEANDGVKRQRS